MFKRLFHADDINECKEYKDDPACQPQERCGLVEHRPTQWTYQNDLWNSTIRMHKCLHKSYFEREVNDEWVPNCDPEGKDMNIWMESQDPHERFFQIKAYCLEDAHKLFDLDDYNIRDSDQ